jgi:centromere protein C
LLLCKGVIYYRKDVKLHDLPPRKRKKGDLKVPARAAQTFNVSPDEINAGYIVGCLELPPLGIKADEGVGPCFQIFNVGDCQPKSLELAIADPDLDGGNFDPDTAKRFLLSKGDMFHIPPGNIYQVQNHSKTHDCAMTWTIVRPPLRQEV